jgi:hypothetical protein
MSKQPTWAINEPKFDADKYDLSLMTSLNYYNVEVDDTVKRNLVIDFWSSQGKDISYFERVAESHFVQLGSLVRLVQRGVVLSEKHDEYILRKYDVIKSVASSVSQEKPKKAEVPQVRKTMEEKITDQVSVVLTKVDLNMDKLTNNGKIGVNDAKTILVGLYPAAGKEIAKFYKGQVQELKDAILNLDPYIRESYSHLSKRTIRAMYDFLTEVVSCCKQASVAATTRKRKEKPASVIASKVSYLKEFSELQMKSVTPDKIVGSDMVFLYNVKLRKIFRYVATDGTTLTIKGTTIQNFNPEKSGSKTVRKPEQFFQGINDMTKRPLLKKFDEIRGVLGKGLGRISGDFIIMKAF